MNIFIGIAIGVLGAGLFFWWSQKRMASKAAELKNELENTFKSLAGDVLKSANTSFLELAKTQLDQESQKQNAQLNLTRKEVELLVKPLSENLEKYKKDLSDAETARAKEYGSLDRVMKMILESNQVLRGETANLVNALKRPTVRGRWGEVQLRRIVELSGLSKHCDFFEQTSTDTDEGRLRPDMIVRLPNGREIIVDSKAVLDGYLEAEASTDTTVRKTALTRHANALKTRIIELSRKNYWDQFKSAPEFVVLFIPGEAFFSAAVEENPDLVEYAFAQKVVLATPTTLMALLKAVAYGWRQEQLAENARRISDQATKIYQGLATWTSHLGDVGSSLNRAVKSYNNSVGSLERTVLPPLRRMKELGVQSKDEVKDIPEIESAIRDFIPEKVES